MFRRLELDEGKAEGAVFALAGTEHHGELLEAQHLREGVLVEADDELPLLVPEVHAVVDQHHVYYHLSRSGVDGEGRQSGQVGGDQETQRLRGRLGPEDAAATRVLRSHLVENKLPILIICFWIRITSCPPIASIELVA